MNKYYSWLIIISLFLLINIFCYFLNKSYLKKLSKEEINNRKTNFKNYNKIVLLNIYIVIILSSFSIILNKRFNYNYNIKEIILHLMILLLINDTWFYWIHRFQHRSKGYFNKIHKIHHTVIESIPLDYIYTHPLELTVSFFGIIIPFLFMNINFLSFIIAIVFRQIHEIDIHSSNHNYSVIPILNSPLKHDKHHTPNKYGNYASMFPFWDKIMNTRIK